MNDFKTRINSAKKIFVIAIPLILQQFFYQIQVLVDRGMLGHINSEYFSAVGNALFPFNTVWSVIIAICGGTTVMIAQCVGANNKKQAQSYGESSIIGNSIISIICFIIFFTIPDVIFGMLGVKSPILEYSVSYVRILSFSLLILGAETTASSVLQGIGTTKFIMVSGIIRNVINIVLDWIFIFGKFGVPQLDIQGAALATTLSNLIVAPILILYVFKSKKLLFRLNIKNIFHVDLTLYKKTIKIGLPSGFESFLWNVGNLIVLSYLNQIDIMSTGIYSLIFSLETIPFFIYAGLARAAMTLVGQETGASNNEGAVKVGFRCMRFSFIICIFFAVAFITCPNQILSLFTNDQSIVVEAAPFLLIVSCTMFPKAVNNVIGLGIQGLGDTKWMLYGQILGTSIVVGLSYFLIFNVGMGLTGLFVTFFVDEFVRAIANSLRFWKGREVFFLKPFEKVAIDDSSINRK